ncbi:MAG: replicative DNA helicase [bacterium]
MVDVSLQKLPPQNIEAEQSILGAILLEKEAISRVLEILKEEDFYKDSHRKIFFSMAEMFEHNEVIDLVTLNEALNKKGILKDIGGASYLAALMEAVPTAANVQHYAKIVRSKSIIRQLVSAASHIVAEGYEDRQEADALLDEAEKLIFEVAEQRVKQGFSAIRDIIKDSFKTIESLYDKKEHTTGLPTGFIKFDDMTSGLQRSDLIIIAARPSMGKTSLCMNIATNVAIRNKLPVAVFSLEMSKEQLVIRMLCSEGRVDAHKLRSGFLSDKDWPKLTNAAAKLSEAPIYIDDSPSCSVLEMRAKARRLKKEKGLSLIIIDYLQLITSKHRTENRQVEIAEISRSLKGIAKELNIPVIALSQLNRASEGRSDKRPQLSDLRESGAIEQDADLVCFIYRDDVYKKNNLENVDDEGAAEIIISKQRNGPVGTVNLAFLKKYTKFENLSSEDAPF